MTTNNLEDQGIDMIIQKEMPDEFPQIYYLVEDAFKTAKISNGKEQDKLIRHIMLNETYDT